MLIIKYSDEIEPWLHPDQERVLHTMFADYAEVVVKSEFKSGLTSSRVFLVRPIRAQSVPELPVVVKIDEYDRIQKEWNAYRTCIRNRLPDVADLNGEPVYPPGSRYGGLQILLAGRGTFPVISLEEYFDTRDLADIRHVLEQRLFKSLNVLWQHRNPRPELRPESYYVSFLPPLLRIKAAASVPGPSVWIHPTERPKNTLRVGDSVQLGGFEIARVWREKPRLMLAMPEGATTRYQILLEDVADIDRYHVGQIINQPLTGVVVQTRDQFLYEQAAQALGAGVDLSAATMTTATGATLPNPLLNLRKLLNNSFDAFVSCTHADLNLQNILIETENRNAYLIDFVNSREDHVLSDLLHLEMAVVTRLLARAMAANDMSAEAIIPFYERLYCAMEQPERVSPPAGLEKPFEILRMIRKTAAHLLFQANGWDEYLKGLTINLLGALKYGDLDDIPGAKQVAFWGAAVSLKMLAERPRCEEKERAEGQRSKEAEEKGASGRRQKESPKLDYSGTTQKRRLRDLFSSYEDGMQRLLVQMGRSHSRYSDALVYQQRLNENIGRARRIGNTSTSKAERAEIIEQLNELSLSVTGRSFNELCQGDD